MCDGVKEEQHWKEEALCDVQNKLSSVFRGQRGGSDQSSTWTRTHVLQSCIMMKKGYSILYRVVSSIM